MKLYAIPHDKLLVVFLEIAQWMPKAASWQSFDRENGGYRAEHVAAEIFSGEVLLWVLLEEDTEKVLGFLTTKIVQRSAGKCLNVVHCAGEEGWLEACMDMVFETFESFARDAGCVGIDFLGRPGWAPFVKQRGYSKTPHVNYYKAI